MMGAQQGMLGLVKDGTRNLRGVDEAVLRNTEAAKKLAQITRTSLGPKGLNKMVINSHGKLFVTSDAATILKELDVIHPAAKILVMASEMQEGTCGDGTNATVSFGGELLMQAESLLRIGLHPSQLVLGYTKALAEVERLLPELVVKSVEDPRSVDEVTSIISAVIGTKYMGDAEQLPRLVAQACVDLLPKEGCEFNVDNVRTCKVLGGNASESTLIKGFAIARGVEGTVKSATGKIVAFATGIDATKTETKANVILRSGAELEAFSKGEEVQVEAAVKAIAETGVKIAVAGGPVGELALHFLEKYGIMVVKVSSKFELRRLCAATGATPLVRLGAPTAEEIGVCDSVSEEEVGSTRLVIFRQTASQSGISTLMLRGSSQNTLDEQAHAVDDGVNAFKGLLRDGRLLAGGGACEMELSRQLHLLGEKCPGLEQYAIKKFADALEVMPSALAKSCGRTLARFMPDLRAAHESGRATAGVDVAKGCISDAADLGVYDLYATKLSMLRLATEAAVDILRVDQIIMAKRAGGPKPPAMSARDA